MRRAGFVVSLLAGLWLVCGIDTVLAQGLIWSLPPEDGAWVRHEGEFQQVEIRPESNEGNLVIKWIRHLWIKSVGRETAEFEGETVPCRWVEIKLITGKPSETGINPGPVGARIYKVLIPEGRVAGTLVDDAQIHISYLPIVKGYRRIGDGEIKPIQSNVLQVYPLLSMLMHYKTLDAEADATVDPNVELKQPVTAKLYKGVYKMESRTGRSVNEALLWRSDDVPFGLAKWSVKMYREAKDAREPRSRFQRMSEVTVEMSAHETGVGAQSELIIPGS